MGSLLAWRLPRPMPTHLTPRYVYVEDGTTADDRMATRALERRALVRGFVERVTLCETGDRHVTFATRDAASATLTDWEGHEPFAVEASDGTLRVDVVSDDVFRIRYAPGPLPDRPSDMVVGTLPAPSVVDVAESEAAVTITTVTVILQVDRSPLTITIRDHEGIELCRLGGPEKNLWGNWDTHPTGVSTTSDGHRLATETHALRPGEAVFGFGEQFGRLQKSGQTIDLNMVEALGTTTPRAYKNVPFFWTTRGYGVFWHTTARATVWVGSRNAADIQVAIEDDHLDQYVFVGDPKTILDRYTTLTGKAHVPPRWSFGWWQSKISYSSAAEALDIVRRYRDDGLPIDVLHLDTHWYAEDWRCDLEFDAERFPDPAGFLAEMDDLGVKVSLWQLPYIPEGSALFEEIDAVEGFVGHPDGGLYDIGLCYTPGFAGRVGCIDFTNPDGVAVYQRHLRRLHELGAAAIKADFGEEAPLDGVYHDGTPGHLAHNQYPLLYNRAVAEATHDATGEWIIWARSAWAGSHRYPLHWGGDSSSNWDNLGPQFAAGLSLGASGFTFWSQDIGGFVTLDPVGGDLLVRWVQAGVLVSHARIHGTGTRELDTLSPETLAAIRPALELRYRLLPYLTGEAHRSAAAGLPMVRPLVIEFPDDPTTWHIDDQWFLGEHLLVAPQLEPSSRRRVYLPEGRWLDWWTNETIEGRQWITIDSPIDQIPLWIREGGVIALGPAMGHVDQHPTEHILLRGLAPATGRTSTGLIGLPDRTVAWTWDQDLRFDLGDIRVDHQLE
jgi:alpha-D-xyloside xylohydrolase